MAQKVKKLTAYNAGDLGSIPRLGRFSEEGLGNSLQYSCLENSMGRHPGGLAKSWTRLSDFFFSRRTHNRLWTPPRKGWDF